VLNRSFLGADGGPTPSGESGGGGGRLTVTAGGRLIVAGRSEVSATNSGFDRFGGAVTLAGGAGITLRDATVTAEATNGDGGTITLAAGGLILARDSTVAATAGRTGALITLSSPFAVALANSIVNGVAGGADAPVTIAAPGFFSDRSRILSDAQAVPSPADVAAATLTLTANLASTPPLPDVCGVRLGRDASSFLVTGRAGAPPAPGGWLADLAPDDWPARAESVKVPAGPR
jgi:hypothetical protein